MENSSDPYIILENQFGPLVYGGRDIRFTHGKGAILYAADGSEYLDFVQGHGVGNLGHSHPQIIQAIKDQAEKLIVLHSSYKNEARAKLFESITKIAPKGLNNTFLSNSGSEAVEAAIKTAIVAHRQIKKPHFIAMKRSFHGRTLGSLALTFGPGYRAPFETSFGLEVSFASFGDIESVKAEIKENTVGIITEIVQGEGGIYPAPLDFPQQLRELCTQKNITLIFDEIQSGMGRTGKMFAFEHYNTVPDIICVAKSLAAGIPIGATIAREDLFRSFQRGEIGSTFGGNPFASAVATAAINVLLTENLISNAKSMGKVIESTAKVWIESGLPLKEQRGLGLMQGLQFKAKVAPYLNACYDNKLLLLNAGMTVIRILPPLVVTKDQITQGLSILETVLKSPPTGSNSQKE
jgi:acetylornithine/LysW-gamma-L-lysine aminotransferase